MVRLPATLSIVLLVNVSLAVSVLSECEHAIVQSMPDGIILEDPKGVLKTHESLLEMIENAKQTLSIASFYWWLTPPKEFEKHPSVVPGQKLMAAIKQASARGVKVEVVLDRSGRKEMSNPEDIQVLERISTLRYLNMTNLLKSGVLHSKFMIADNKSFYVGSSNFDWRSYTQIKEIGITFTDCPALAEDMDKIFRTYSMIAETNKVPEKMSDDFKTSINMNNPLVLAQEKVFLSGSPPPFNGYKASTGRTDDIDGLLHIINKAQHRLDISVMNYSPRVEFGWPREYWPRIDDAIRRAAVERRVKVRLLFSNWTSSKPLESVWYRSLNAIQSNYLRGGGIHVKLFQVPAFDDFQRSIPFARVKHDKYMVTDNGLYIGTSNWTPDYFINTCGVGVVIEPSVQGETSDMMRTMQEIFERDFNSKYAHELD